MSKTIYLVRHGEYDESNDSLIDSGRQQMQFANRILFRDMRDLERITIYHGPVIRVRESAEELAEAMRAKMNVSLEERGCLREDYRAIGQVVDEISEQGIIVSHLGDLYHYMKQQGIETTFKCGQVRRVIL